MGVGGLGVGWVGVGVGGGGGRLCYSACSGFSLLAAIPAIPAATAVLYRNKQGKGPAPSSPRVLGPLLLAGRQGGAGN
jgi:hypothetical protein